MRSPRVALSTIFLINVDNKLFLSLGESLFSSLRNTLMTLEIVCRCKCKFHSGKFLNFQIEKLREEEETYIIDKGHGDVGEHGVK